jgi:xanthosine utilization system XapX-like protein
MLIGEQIVPLGSKLIKGEPITAAWFAHDCIPKITGTSGNPAKPESDVAKNTAD